MDRTEYLKRCKECAMLCAEGMYKVRKNVPPEVLVEYKGVRYYPVGYQLTYDSSGSVVHTAVIHDLRANSVIYVPLKEIT